MPEDKIVSRYARSLGLWMAAICHTDRAYIFDNSSHRHVWLAEITDGDLLEMKTEQLPKSDKIEGQEVRYADTRANHFVA